MMHARTFKTLTDECQLVISEHLNAPKFTGEYSCVPGTAQIRGSASFRHVTSNYVDSGELSADSLEELLANFRQVVQKDYGGTIIREF
jgi:hypothetical protein